MNMKNRGGREARKPKAAKNVKAKGQTPPPAGSTTAPGNAATNAVHRSSGTR
jgi:hypothetical protein